MRPRSRPLVVLTAAVLLLLTAVAPSVRAQATERIDSTRATIAGVVRDSTGAPITDAEVVLVEYGRGTRADTAGRFLLDVAPPGQYVVWFRRLGYRTARFEWVARGGEMTQLAITLHQVPQQLDPIEVRADEDREVRGTASVTGVVVDDAGRPVTGAEVQLIGGRRSTTSTTDGRFSFKDIVAGPYAVRVRRLGYSPAIVHLSLLDADERELSLRIGRLAQSLDTVKVRERSGFGNDIALQDYAMRLAWRGANSMGLDRADLERFGRKGLDLALMLAGAGNVVTWQTMRDSRATPHLPGGGGYQPPIQSVRGKSDRGGLPRPEALIPTAEPVPLSEDPSSPMGALGGEACVLLDGERATRMYLRALDASQVEKVEIYPSGSDLTGTIQTRMQGIPQCRGEITRHQHPLYLVVWTRK